MSVTTKHTKDTKRELPPGWKWVRLGALGQVIDGDWILNTDYTESGVRLIQVGDVGCGRFIGKSLRFISLERAIELKCTLLRPGDILISRMPDPIGRACRLPDLGYQCITAVDVSILRLYDNNVIADTLVAYMNTEEWYHRVLNFASGATRPRISRSKLQVLEIPLPPLPEQQRIAAILREQMAAVERARKAAEERLDAVKSLADAFLRQVFPQPGQPLPPGWKWVRLGEVCERLDYGYTASADFFISSPKFLRITDIQNGQVVWASVPGCAISSSLVAEYELHDGDIVFARTGATTGKSFLIDNPPCSVFASYLIRVRPSALISPAFLYAYFQSDEYWQTIRDGVRGGAQGGFNASMLAGFKIPLPPLPEQQRIAAILREQMAAVERARKAAEEELETINALPAALLRRAFAGEL